METIFDWNSIYNKTNNKSETKILQSRMENMFVKKIACLVENRSEGLLRIFYIIRKINRLKITLGWILYKKFPQLDSDSSIMTF